MKLYILILFLISSVCFAQVPNLEITQLDAFIGSKGFASTTTTGGRSGAIIDVTNTNATGAGSLRAALEASGTRTINVKTCGTIDLGPNPIIISNPNVTLNAHFACGGGIQVINNGIRIETSNVIIRGLRIRRYDTPDFSVNALSIGGSSSVQNVIIDHCDINMSSDENFVIARAYYSAPDDPSIEIKNITVQNSITSQNHHLMLISSNVERLSVIDNLFAFSNDRAPLVSSFFGLDEVAPYLRAEMINNVIYDVGSIGLITSIATDPQNGAYNIQLTVTATGNYTLKGNLPNVVSAQTITTNWYLKGVSSVGHNVFPIFYTADGWTAADNDVFWSETTAWTSTKTFTQTANIDNPSVTLLSGSGTAGDVLKVDNWVVN